MNLYSQRGSPSTYRMRRFASLTSNGPRDGVVGKVLFAGERLNAELRCSSRRQHRRERTVAPSGSCRRAERRSRASASVLPPSRTVSVAFWPAYPCCVRRDGSRDRAFARPPSPQGSTSSISTSCAGSSRPKPMVCTGSRRLRNACSASGAIPEPPSPCDFWPPSLSSTIAPSGKIRSLRHQLLQPVVDVRRRFRWARCLSWLSTRLSPRSSR